MGSTIVDGIDIPPVFIVQKDLLALTTNISTTAICLTLNDAVENSAIGAQLQLDGIWRIYVSSCEARAALVENGITVCGNSVTIHTANPSISTRRSSEKVILKDLPLSMSNLRVMQQILKIFPRLKITSQVQCARDVLTSSDGKRTYSPFLTGDRFFYIETPVSVPLPKILGIEGFRCRVWHYSQKHFCIRCDQPDHVTDNFSSCPAYRDPSTITSFRSRFDPLCNMYKCSVGYNDKQFKSSEHLYGYRKCQFAGEAALAEQVFNAPDPFAAKRLTQSLDPAKLKEWHAARADIMKDILLAKATSVTNFREALLNSGDNIIVEVTDDPYWGCGITNQAVASSIDPTYFKGSNMLGNILMQVRSLIAKGDEHIMSSDSDDSSDNDDSSSGEESDSNDNEEFMDAAPAVPDASTQLPNTATTSTPINTQSKDLFPMFSGSKKGADSSADQRPTARPMTNISTPTTRTDSLKRGRHDSTITDTDQSINNSKVADTDVVKDHPVSSQQADSANVRLRKSANGSSKMSKKKSKKASKKARK